MEKSYEYREERPDREGLLRRDRPRRQGGPAGAGRRRHRVDHPGGGLAAGRNAPRTRGAGGLGKDAIGNHGDLAHGTPGVRSAGRPGPGRRLRQGENQSHEQDVGRRLDLRHHGTGPQTDEHPGVHRHAGTGAGLADGCPTAKEIPMYDQSKLSELIRFARVDAGSTVIDVYPGEGDWTRRFSDVVGPEGRVYSFVPAEVAHFKNDPVGLMRTLAKEPGRGNVEAVSADLVAMPDVTQPAEVLWLHLFYHDLHTALMQARGATAAQFNRAVYDRLRPGGSYVVIDHAAATGAGTSDAQSLHRIEAASARAEVEAAGFVLGADSIMPANKDVRHSIKVFAPSIKGETDRFAYRFVKP